MSKHQCWYVSGRALRLALVYALFASLLVANPAFAVEDTELTAQKAAISYGQVTAVNSAATVPSSEGTEQEEFTQTVATQEAADLDVLAPAAGNVADGVVVLPKTGEAYQAILELTRNGRTVSPAVIVWERDFEYFLPVKSLSEILKFPSIFDPQTRNVEGEFFNSQNLYSIDVPAGTITVLGEASNFEPSDVLSTPEAIDDLYVMVDLLNRVWPLEFEIDSLTQTISINTKRKIPFELELERKRRQEKLEREKREKEAKDRFTETLNYKHNGYRLLGPQTFVLSQRLAWRNGPKDLANSYFLSGQGDLLGASANYSLSFGPDSNSAIDIQDFNIRLKRQDYKSGRLLPYNLKLIDVGDISVRSPSLVSGSLQGRGIFLSTDRNNSNVSFDEVTIEGQAKPGWDVEIYSRGVLINFGVVDELGNYRFEAIPLNYGNNRIRLVFYGPQGQIEERFENYRIGRRFLKPGEMTYEFGVVERGNRVIAVGDNRENNGKSAGTLRVNRGISPYMSGYATFTNLGLGVERERYLSVGANFTALDGAGQIEAYKQIDGGTALDFRYAKDFLGFSTNLRTSLYNDFESQRSGVGNSRRESETSLNVVKRFSELLSGLSLNLGFTADYTTFETQDSEIRLGTSQAVGLPFGNLSHTTDTRIIGGETTDGDGQIAFSTSLNDNIGFNSRLDYNYIPEKEFNNLDFGLSYSDNDRLSASIGYGQSLLDSESRTASLGASYDFDEFTGNLNLGWDSEDGIDFSLSTTTTLGPRGKDELYDFRRRLDGKPTALAVQLYEDLNENGEFDSTDTPIPNARVLLNGNKKSSPSNENGFIDLTPAGAEGLTSIVLDRKSLQYNPFLISAKKAGHLTVLRTGTKPFINFPLIMSGNIDGTVRDVDGRGMAGIIVQLIDAQGKLVNETTTILDGFYVFELVRPGRYIVQVHPSHRVFVPPKTVRVASDDLFAYGVDLQVLEPMAQDLEQAKEAAVVNDVGEGRVAHTYHPAATVGTKEPASTPADHGVQSVVSAVRIGEHPHKVRLVLDLSGPADYEIKKEGGGSVIYVELPKTGWAADHEFKPNKHNIFANCEIQTLPGGGTQIKLTAKDKVDVFYNAALPAEGGRNDRIYIDFTRAQ